MTMRRGLSTPALGQCLQSEEFWGIYWAKAQGFCGSAIPTAQLAETLVTWIMCCAVFLITSGTLDVIFRLIKSLDDIPRNASKSEA